MHVGDERAAVLSNRETVCNALGVDCGTVVAARQVHGDGIFAADDRDKGRGALDGEGAVPGVDALVTNACGLPLVAFFADCVCIFLLDPVRNVIGLAHAGWKGTALKIGAKTVKHMG
ncbi:MAG TPA: laccase domain-containing protein, partial [Clostridia bacterium]|nr:laccase domain-containing protein [Clostridia bacterium]